MNLKRPPRIAKLVLQHRAFVSEQDRSNDVVFGVNGWDKLSVEE
jgi:hypothetical protein